MSVIEIEDNPRLRSAMRTTIEWSFTTLMWVLWIYLFLPLVSLVLWVVGLRYIYNSLFEQSALVHLMSLMSRMGWAVLIIFIVLRGWGYYNYYVFGRRNRRQHREPLDNSLLCRHFGLSESKIEDLQSQKEIEWEPLYDTMVANAN